MNTLLLAMAASIAVVGGLVAFITLVNWLIDKLSKHVIDNTLGVCP